MKRMEFLEFTKRERTGIVSLVVLIIVTASVPGFFCGNEEFSPDFSTASVELKRSDQNNKDINNHDTFTRKYKHEYVTYDFNKPVKKKFASNNIGFKKFEFSGKRKNKI